MSKHDVDHSMHVVTYNNNNRECTCRSGHTCKRRPWVAVIRGSPRRPEQRRRWPPWRRQEPASRASLAVGGALRRARWATSRHMQRLQEADALAAPRRCLRLWVVATRERPLLQRRPQRRLEGRDHRLLSPHRGGRGCRRGRLHASCRADSCGCRACVKRRRAGGAGGAHTLTGCRADRRLSASACWC